MQHDLGMEDSLSKKQFGFKRGTSTETALHKVIHKIEKRIAKKGYVLGTFLDVEGAFDNVSFKAISEAINQSPLDSATAGWIKNMVTNRHVTITHKNATRRIKTKRRCPQGGVLSPFLWNLVKDDLLQYTAKHIPGYIQAFADNIMSLAEGDDLDVIWQRTQTTIKTIENGCQSKGLNISAVKTKIVMFTWNRKWSLRPIEVCGETIELSNEVKLLGISYHTRQQTNIQHSYQQHNQKMHWQSLLMQKSHRPHMGPLTEGMPLDIHSNNQTYSSLLFYRVDQSCGEQNQD